MATPPGGGGEVPQAGYYPDPSIPGYIRYWNGGAWVPGTSRPAPKDGEAAPVPPASAMPAGPILAPSPAPAPAPEPGPVAAPASAPAAVEETGPVFFDEEPPVREPATAWRADASRQSGPDASRPSGHGEGRDPSAAWPAPRAAEPAPAA
ncbi:DUF2510 domain-containing protein, partial [Streptomyces sp. NPDC035033]|uniref:DUF2510 domain-containing protein n=1 Tax=Streptomyces sp. NPDC035033 TaxID=3155368 RepID=UPI0033ED25A0